MPIKNSLNKIDDSVIEYLEQLRDRLKAYTASIDNTLNFIRKSKQSCMTVIDDPIILYKNTPNKKSRDLVEELTDKKEINTEIEFDPEAKQPKQESETSNQTKKQENIIKEVIITYSIPKQNKSHNSPAQEAKNETIIPSKLIKYPYMCTACKTEFKSLEFYTDKVRKELKCPGCGGQIIVKSNQTERKPGEPDPEKLDKLSRQSIVPPFGYDPKPSDKQVSD